MVGNCWGGLVSGGLQLRTGTCTHVPVTPYLYPCTHEIQISKIPPGSHQINIRTRRTRCTCRPVNPLERKQQKKNSRTRTRVPATGTCMRRVGYSFKKKLSTRTRLPAVPVSVPAAGVPGPYPSANHYYCLKAL
jgi:hypothetical protein